MKAALPQRTTLKLDMNFDDNAVAQMLKDYSVFSFVLRVMFLNETKGYLSNLELVCFDVVVENITFNKYMEMAISICKV